MRNLGISTLDGTIILPRRLLKASQDVLCMYLHTSCASVILLDVHMLVGRLHLALSSPGDKHHRGVYALRS